MAGNSITGSALRGFDIYLSLITKITINRYKRKGGKHQRREVAQADVRDALLLETQSVATSMAAWMVG